MLRCGDYLEDAQMWLQILLPHIFKKKMFFGLVFMPYKCSKRLVNRDTFTLSKRRQTRSDYWVKDMTWNMIISDVFAHTTDLMQVGNKLKYFF